MNRCMVCNRSLADGFKVCVDCDEYVYGQQYLREAAAADTHSSDVDPGRIDPWAER